MAMKLLGTRGSSELERKNLQINFEKHLKAKALLCKLPLINMSDN
jgi:hypothetical protein